VFSELEIGTGKPDRSERAAVPHHLFDALRLGESASAGWYAAALAPVLTGIRGREKVPILVGGSGLYLNAAREGLTAEPPRDEELRARLREQLAADGAAALHRRLAEVDAASAERLHPNDGQRIVRALEVYEASGRPLSWWHAQGRQGGDGHPWRVFELEVEPFVLNRRIRERSEWMFANGLVEETRALLEAGRGDALRALHAIGYDEALDVIEDRSSITRATKDTSLRTRQLAKRQRTWFRHQVDAVRIDATDGDVSGLCAYIRAAIDTGGGTL
jgi:tRNA dimethylallyltransferase